MSAVLFERRSWLKETVSVGGRRDANSGLGCQSVVLFPHLNPTLAASHDTVVMVSSMMLWMIFLLYFTVKVLIKNTAATCRLSL